MFTKSAFMPPMAPCASPIFHPANDSGIAMILCLNWFLEFLLEISGAIFSYRRRMLPVALYMTFRAFSDIAGFLILHNCGWRSYAWSLWTSRAFQFALLCVIVAQLLGRFLIEVNRKKIVLMAGALLFVSFWGISAAIKNAQTWPDKFLDADLAGRFLLMLIVAGGWFAAKYRLERPWSLIAAAMITGLAWDSAITLTWKLGFWLSAHGFAEGTVLQGARYLYPLGRIAALVLWNWALLGKTRLRVVRVSLGNRLQPQRVETEEVRSRFVM